MLVGRDSVVLELQHALAGGFSCLIRGARGTGRSAIIDELVSHQDGNVVVVRGRDSVEGVLMAPFAPLLAERGADLGDTLRIYTEFAVDLAGSISLLAVDDLDCLDPGSAVLVSQLHRAGVTILGSVLELSAVAAGLKEIARRWTPIDLLPLEPQDVAAIVEAQLGSNLLVPSLKRLVPVAAGLPGPLHLILDEARTDALLLETEGGTRLGEIPITDAVMAAAGWDTSEFEQQFETIEVLATSGRTPEALFKDADITELARRGLAVADGDVAELIDPLWRAWALYRLSPALRKRTMLRIARRWSELESPAPHSAVLETCARGVGDLVKGGRWLLDQGRLDEAAALVEDLSTGSSGDPFQLALLRADIHLELGRIAAATQALDDAEQYLQDGAPADALVERWITVLGGRRAHEQSLRERVTRVLDRIQDPSTRTVVMAAWQRRQAVVGFSGTLAHLESSHDDPVVVALRESMTGSLEVARSVAAPSDADKQGDGVDLDEQFRVLAHFLSLVYDGQLTEGREIADRHYRIAYDEARPTLGLWTYNLSKIAFHAGQYNQAATYAAEARRHLAWRDVAGQALPADAMLAAALARLGRLDQAEQMAMTLTTDDRTLPRVRIGVARVEAETLRRSGRHDEAAEALASAGEYAVSQDEAHSGLLAVDESFMIRPTAAVGELLSSLRDKSALVAAFADRAVAQLERNPDALMGVAARFEDMVQPGRAAHAWLTSASLYENSRRSEQARKARQHAVRVSTQWQVTPWPTERPEEMVLTAREYEIAVRASARQRSREIAADLDLSVRTVDNHLARVYRKLGISRRDELTDALDLG